MRQEATVIDFPHCPSFNTAKGSPPMRLYRLVPGLVTPALFQYRKRVSPHAAPEVMKVPAHARMFQYRKRVSPHAAYYA